MTPDELRQVLERTARYVDEVAGGCERLLERVRRDRLRCCECRKLWDDPRERFRSYLVPEDPPLVLMYCGSCAAREFDEGGL